MAAGPVEHTRKRRRDGSDLELTESRPRKMRKAVSGRAASADYIPAINRVVNAALQCSEEGDVHAYGTRTEVLAPALLRYINRVAHRRVEETGSRGMGSLRPSALIATAVLVEELMADLLRPVLRDMREEKAQAEAGAGAGAAADGGDDGSLWSDSAESRSDDGDHLSEVHQNSDSAADSGDGDDAGAQGHSDADADVSDAAPRSSDASGDEGDRDGEDGRDRGSDHS